MNLATTQFVLQDRKISYIITDQELKVVEISADINKFIYNGVQTVSDCSIFDLLPELTGSEAALIDIIAGKLPRFELTWVNREIDNDQIIYLSLVSLPHQNQAGQITGLIHLVQDVTEVGEIYQQLAQRRNELHLLQDRLKAQNLELATANAELQHLDEVKSKFISIAAHELSTPLTALSGFMEVLLDGDCGAITEHQREYLEIMQHSSERLVTIVRELFDITRIETGRIQLMLQPVNLLTLVKSTIAEFKLQLEAKAHQMTLDIQPDLPFALCDKTRAAQIINNLISNAIKYTPQQGQIIVGLGLSKEEGFLQISVADTGVGISVDDQSKLFKRFFRAESAEATGATGTGLGLYVVHSLVELHGGRTWFESELNKGSTFYVIFPVAGRPITVSK